MATQSVKTRVWNDIELTRHTRPYRLAVIELVFIPSPLTPTFRVVFSEFGNNIVSNPIKLGAAGTYTLDVAPSAFSNLQNVVTASTITYNGTTVTGNYTDMYVSSYFNSTNYNQIRIITSDVANNALNFVGKIFISIKEYYG